MAERREGMSVKSFLEIFVPAAKAGKSALEIGQRMGIQGTDKQIATYVNVKSAQIRASFRDKAEVAGRTRGLSGESLDQFVAAIVERVPKLARHGGAGRKATDVNELVAFVDGLFAAIDAKAEPEAPAANAVPEPEVSAAKPKRRKSEA